MSKCCYGLWLEGHVDGVPLPQPSRGQIAFNQTLGPGYILYSDVEALQNCKSFEKHYRATD